MLYKEDWPQARQRWEAFWDGEIIDRVALAVRAPRALQVAEPMPPNDEVRHTDPDFVIAYYNALFQNTF